MRTHLGKVRNRDVALIQNNKKDKDLIICFIFLSSFFNLEMYELYFCRVIDQDLYIYLYKYIIHKVL